MDLETFQDRELVPRPNNGKHKYLYTLIWQLDLQRHAVKKSMSLTFFDHEKLPIDKAGEFYNAVLCCFKDGTFASLPAGCYGPHSRQYLGPRYILLKSWALLPIPESKLNPGFNSSYDSFYCNVNTILGTNASSNIVIADFHYIWQNKLKGVNLVASTLASLWRKGYDTISSLGLELQKSISSSVTSLESLSLQNTPDITSSNTSTNTNKS